MRRFSWLLIALSSMAAAQNMAPWKFAVSGDSRNCGDIVMPAIAQGVRQSGANFYWHLGDFRAIYAFDEDMVPPAQLGVSSKPLNIIQYETSAWPDFLAHQIAPFGDIPVFLAIGNHETIPPATRTDYLLQFADWLNAPVLREQRLKDDPQDRKLRAYYHWVKDNVDFLTLDNASDDQFDSAQMKWIHSVIDRDEKSSQIQTIVVGMHEALPGSLGESHSMSESTQGAKTGREVYEALLHAQNIAHKHIYVLASHSHFYMEDIFRTDAWKDKVLPGWIVGTAGAVRYRLPPDMKSGPTAMTDVYGFMVATVAPDGSLSTSFQPLSLDDLRHANPGTPEPLVRWCFQENSQR
jgi:hypothetical protein